MKALLVETQKQVVQLNAELTDARATAAAQELREAELMETLEAEKMISERLRSRLKLVAGAADALTSATTNSLSVEVEKSEAPQKRISRGGEHQDEDILLEEHFVINLERDEVSGTLGVDIDDALTLSERTEI